MPLYVADYIADTMHLSAAEHGAYLLLIMHYWRTSSLPKSDEALARIARMTPPEWARSKEVINAFFYDGWKHKRIDQELAESERITGTARRAGHASAERRRNGKPTDPPTESQRKANGPPNGKPTESQRSGNDPPNETATESQPSQSQPQSLDRIGDARERPQSAFTDGSKALATTFWKALGFERPIDIPPEFAGVDWRAIEWERAGWTVDLIDSETRKIARDRPFKPLSYFEKVFATSFAKRQTPLPIVEIREAEKLTVIHGKTQSRSGSLIDTINRELADLEDAEDNDPALPKGPVLRLSN